jgi:catechol 2,3-dioxygenase-like lactoylglutathione lyase family enzyme
MTFSPDDLTHLYVVADLERSVAFYRDVLGAEVHGEYGGTSVVLRLAESWLLLVTAGGPTEDKPDVHFVAPSDPAHVSHELIFKVPDCHAAYEELRSRGAEFLTPPKEYEWEIRAFFRDPDGYLFEISQNR